MEQFKQDLSFEIKEDIELLREFTRHRVIKFRNWVFKFLTILAYRI